MPFTFTVPAFIGNAFSDMSTVIFGKPAKDLSLHPPKKKSRRERKDYSDPYLFPKDYRIDTVIKKPITEVYEKVIPNDIVSSSDNNVRSYT